MACSDTPIWRQVFLTPFPHIGRTSASRDPDDAPGPKDRSGQTYSTSGTVRPGDCKQRDEPYLDEEVLYRRAGHSVCTGRTRGRGRLSSGHAPVVHEACNSAFQAGGPAVPQWEATFAACLVPGLLRRLSWQRLVANVAEAPDLAWHVGALRDRYGLGSERQGRPRDSFSPDACPAPSRLIPRSVEGQTS